MQQWTQMIRLALLMAVVFMCLTPDLAQAQVGSTPAVPHGTCTTDPQFEIPIPAPGDGIISSLVVEIQTILGTVSSAMFIEITTDYGFRVAVQAAMTLYIMFYGIMFTFGMVQITMYDFAIRMIKLGVVVLLISPLAWSFFNVTVAQFFNAGTDAWINQVTSAVLNEPLPNNAPPFYVIDQALSKMVSAKMAVTMLAMFFSPPYGPIFGLLLAMGLGTFMRAILTASWVYLMSLILKALLFGIAPIFLACIMFQRTRHLFDGWLNQIINATLQPILLFTFLSFFVVLISVGIDNVLLTPVCWTEWAESLRGSPFSVHYWRFAICRSTGFCEPYGGAWSYDGPQSAQGPIFPVDLLGILVLVMLADLCARFNGIVVMIASDLAGAGTNLATMQGALGDWFSKAGQAGKQAAGEGVGKIMPNERDIPGGGGADVAARTVPGRAGGGGRDVPLS